MIISFKLLTYCLIIGGIYLLIMDVLWNLLEKRIPVFDHFPPKLLESKGLSWFVSSFIIEFVFFVFMPAVIYGWFYTVIPFYGIRGGVATGLYLFLFGMVPLTILTMFRVKIPGLYMLYLLLGLMIKLIGAMAIIGYLYSL
ncbi:MAG: hypothetical protein JSV44_06745 [Candidatus Zixiibacteriota bacterium]|nr:MAG: hypothetical protein JSV44_06745 [candidate division Zixibacteria bacterium]